MGTPDAHLVRTAFLTKYGYSPDLTYDEILREFQRRYDRAQMLQYENVGVRRIMLVIEGMSENLAIEDAAHVQELRKLRLRRLAEKSGYGVTELEQMVEGYATRLEADWIQRKN